MSRKDFCKRCGMPVEQCECDPLPPLTDAKNVGVAS